MKKINLKEVVEGVNEVLPKIVKSIDEFEHHKTETSCDTCGVLHSWHSCPNREI